MATEAGIWSAYAMPRHPDGTVDGRYTLATEWGGYAAPVWTARFCGEFIGSDLDEMRALFKITDHNRRHRESLGIA